MSVARFNFSHGSHEYHQVRFKLLYLSFSVSTRDLSLLPGEKEKGKEKGGMEEEDALSSESLMRTKEEEKSAAALLCFFPT
jgi:pyruvate kinase